MNEHQIVYSNFTEIKKVIMHGVSGLVCVAVCGIVVTAAAAERLSLESRPLLAGRASLTADGFVEARTLGTANFTPELHLSMEDCFGEGVRNED